jgi:hypothetical protein
MRTATLHVRNPPGEAIRDPSRSSAALDPEPTAQTDPSRSLSLAFGTALPTREETFPARSVNGVGGWKGGNPDLPDLGCPCFEAVNLRPEATTTRHRAYFSAAPVGGSLLQEAISNSYDYSVG